MSYLNVEIEQQLFLQVVTMIGRADIEVSKSNVAMNAYLAAVLLTCPYKELTKKHFNPLFFLVSS